jgi:hypothetical protein
MSKNDEIVDIISTQPLAGVRCPPQVLGDSQVALGYVRENSDVYLHFEVDILLFLKYTIWQSDTYGIVTKA